ncbi:hypothetical protein [Georhizobium profundi]|uniref:hypothetical protein n=1 Tax=Georhizobium profundi TaxID=2341112 RepID=UPI002684250F
MRGVSDVPALRESALALTVVNHPSLIIEEFDEITSVEFDNVDLDRLWKAILGASTDSARIDRERMLAHLEAQGFSPLVATLERQIRNARLWVATQDAALEDAREGFFQALSLNKRARVLKWQKQELERDIAEATEASDEELISTLLLNLEQVQMEITRFENQHAIIDGFGVLSGRSKAVARV